MSRNPSSAMHHVVPPVGHRSLSGAFALVAVLVAGCASAAAPTAALMTASAPTLAATPALPTATAAPVAMPPGRILFHRLKADEVEDYFTIDTDGSNELALFTLQGCGCARLSPDGTHVWTMGQTKHGTYSFTAMRLDGSQREVVAPPSKTLNLGPAATSQDGHWLAFDGWDETKPARNGLYLGSSDLTDLRFVMALPDGAVRFEPFAVTPDGSGVLLFLEEGAEGPFTHYGGVYLVDRHGTGLRQLNPAGTWHGWTGDFAGGLSPDGRRVAFATDQGVFIADLDGGEPERIGEWTGFASVVSWSPTGEWISYTRHSGTAAVLSLVQADGSEEREFPAATGSRAVWSPDGQHLLVRRGEEGREDLWIVDLDGNPVGQVTHEPATYHGYSWAPG
jgi:hypothetical protein